jgi:radical SAM protein with 4Fe4S-binding SPASM domain
MRVGSVLEEDLGMMLEASPVLRDLRERYRVERYDRCSTCTFRRWCAGDCRGEALAASHSAIAPSIHCEELQRIHLRALWLAARRDPRLPLSTQDPLPC